jgi:hypothetical protein
MDRKIIALATLIMTAKAISQRPNDIRVARIGGATWEEIADALCMSRAQVIKLSKMDIV